MAHTNDPLIGTRYRPRPELLPLAVRQVLWRRLWDQLLMPAPTEVPPKDSTKPDVDKEPRS